MIGVNEKTIRNDKRADKSATQAGGDGGTRSIDPFPLSRSGRRIGLKVFSDNMIGQVSGFGQLRPNVGYPLMRTADLGGDFAPRAMRPRESTQANQRGDGSRADKSAMFQADTVAIVQREQARADRAVARALIDRPAVVAASTLRIRAERRVGELLAEQQRNTGGRPWKQPVAVDDRLSTLPELGITRDESSAYQRLAAAPADHFDRAIATVRRLARVRDTVVNDRRGGPVVDRRLAELRRVPLRREIHGGDRRIGVR